MAMRYSLLQPTSGATATYVPGGTAETRYWNLADSRGWAVMMGTMASTWAARVAACQSTFFSAMVAAQPVGCRCVRDM